ncbi:MAG: hypothetical protein ABWY04_14035 [Arthrobacter sp.]
MEAVFLIILLAVLVGVVWWRLNAKKSADAGGAGRQPDGNRIPGATGADGALSGGSAAASAEAAGTSGMASAAGFGRPAEPAAPTTADEPAETAARVADHGPAAVAEHDGTGSAAAAGSPDTVSREERRAKDDAEWETQWSEAAPAPSHEGMAHRESPTLREGAARQDRAAQQDRGVPAAPIPATDSGSAVTTGSAGNGATAPQPVHHPEYTEPHAPTLPGAETAAVEEQEESRSPGSTSQLSAAATGRTDTGAPTPASVGTGNAFPRDVAAAEIQDRTQSSALVEAGADHTQDQAAATSQGTEPAADQSTAEGRATEPATAVPAGHLAAEEPYGAGSASTAADGSGPAGYTVKGEAGGMVYYEEGHPEYEQTRADVWFESPAHAEAAGFRAPRRRRI